MRTAIINMKDKRDTGPSGVAAELFKAMEGVGVHEVTAAFRRIMDDKCIL